MNAFERLDELQRATREGRHEDALRECIWFHDHVLEQEPAMYGVRLSYALGDWAKLGEVYAPARQALQDVRDRKTPLKPA